MLGKKSANDTYGSIIGIAIQRINGKRSGDQELFKINSDGELVVKNSTDPAIKLDAQKFTNIALVVDPAMNTKTLYVNGVFAGTSVFDTSNKSSGFILHQIRTQYNNTSDSNLIINDTDTSYFYNHLYVYSAEAPLCLINTDIIEESEGVLGLYETDEPEEGTNPLTELTVTEDKQIFLNKFDKSSNYTFSFTLSATSEFVNGTILQGNKVDAFNTYITAELLTVKDGYLYYFDIPVYKIVAGEDISIKLICVDYLSKVTVIVNDKEIIKDMPYSTGDNYERGDSYIKSYIFSSAAGEYTVSDINFVTNVSE